MTKETIYDEVLMMLNARVDYKSITLAEVARRCQIGKSTIYEYFASKDEMVFNSMLYYLNRMIRFFSQGFKITTYRASMKTFIKAVMITMKANFWMVMPWTFLDNYGVYFTEEDEQTISNLLYKSQELILTLFTSICKLGEQEGTLFKLNEFNINFAYNGIIGELTENIDAEYDIDSDEAKELMDNLTLAVTKQLN